MMPEPQFFKPNGKLPEKIELLALSPLAQESKERLLPKIQNVLPLQSFSPRAYPREITLINNQRANRALSRTPVVSDTSFPWVKGEKILVPSESIRKRLANLRRSVSGVYQEEALSPSQGALKEKVIPRAVLSEFPKKVSDQAFEVQKTTEGVVPSLKHEKTELEEKDKLEDESLHKEEVLSRGLSVQELGGMAASYQGKVRDLTHRLKELNRQIQQAEQYLTRLRKGREVLQQEKIQKDPAYQNLQTRVEEFKRSLSHSQQTISDLEEKLSEKEKERRNYQESMAREHEATRKVYEEKRAAEALVKNLRSALKNAQEEMGKTKGKAVTAEELREKEEKIQRLSALLSEKEASLQSMRSLSSEFEEKIQEEKGLKKEIVSLKDEIANLRNARQTLVQKVEAEENELTKLRSEMQDLLERNRRDEQNLSDQQAHLTKLRSEKERLAVFANELSVKLAELQNKKYVERVVEGEVEERKVSQPQVVRVVHPKPLQTLDEKKPLTTVRNAISGVLKDQKGRFVRDAVVIIKDLTNQPLRALRTNELGQFVVATPLRNGTYRLEIEKEGLKFDILEVELKGELLAPLEIRAR